MVKLAHFDMVSKLNRGASRRELNSSKVKETQSLPWFGQQNRRSCRHVEVDVIDSTWLRCYVMAIAKDSCEADVIEESMKRDSSLYIFIKPLRGIRNLLQFPTEVDKIKTLHQDRVWLDK
ncbi:hypothetical protein U1Q18_037296 [Sarracenia purpurea var. burkii]